MFFSRRSAALSLSILTAVLAFTSVAASQDKKSILVITDGNEIKKIVPSSFYFAGQSAPTQMRNAAAARIGENRHVIAGLVDTSGYSTEISGKYEGFIITDSPIRVGDKNLDTGAYGFGFSADGKVNIFDLGSRELVSVKTVGDVEMRRPRPLMMSGEERGVRLYKGKNYVLISPR